MLPKILTSFLFTNYGSLQPNGTPGLYPSHGNPDWYCEKPLGYSWFPRELGPMPVAWVRKQGNLVWHRQHSEVGSSTPLAPRSLFEYVD